MDRPFIHERRGGIQTNFSDTFLEVRSFRVDYLVRPYVIDDLVLIIFFVISASFVEEYKLF